MLSDAFVSEPGPLRLSKVKRTENWTIGRIPGVTAIPDHWEITQLSDIAQLESGHTPSRRNPEYWTGGEVRWLSLHDTKDMDVHVMAETKLKITELGLANSSARLLPPGTVALSRTATIGKCVILGREMATSQDFACYVCGPRVDNRFLLQLFRDMQSTWAALSGGSTHKTIYMPIFQRLQVPLPPLLEQKKIAAILSSVDDAIQAKRAVIEQTRRVKEGLLQDLLMRGIGHTRFKQTEIGEIPEGWNVATLSSLCAIDHGFAFKGKLFTESPTNYHLLTPGNFSVHGGYQPRKTKFYRGEVDPTYLLSTGDLLVTMTDLTPGCQTLGLPLRVPEFQGYSALHNQRLGKVRVLEPDRLDSGFLYCLLLSKPYRAKIKETASGSTVRHTSPTRILSSRVPLPSLAEQRKILSIVLAPDSSIDSLALLLRQFQHLKAGLLQDLLTGKVRVTV